MLQHGRDNFADLTYNHLKNIWDGTVYPDQWATSLMQPIHKGGEKDGHDTASYRWIYLSNTLVMQYSFISTIHQDGFLSMKADVQPGSCATEEQHPQARPDVLPGEQGASRSHA